MAVYEIIPSTNVKMEDIRDTLNDAGGSVDNTLGSFFNMVGYQAQLNMWSKFKPIHYTSSTALTDAQYAAANYGVTFPSPTNFSQSLSVIQSVCAKEWIYDYPKGGSSSPYRLSDFRRYYANAKPPIQIVGSGFEVNKVVSSVLNIYADIDPDDSAYNLQGSDLNQGGINLKYCSLYGCIADGSTVKAWLQASGTLLDGNGNINVTYITYNCRSLSNITYTVYLCLKYADGTNTYLYPLPDYDTFSLKVISDTSAAGVAIASTYGDIAFAPAFGATFYTADYCCDGGGYYNRSMYNATGEMLCRVKFTNNTSSAKSVKVTDFSFMAYSSTSSKRKTKSVSKMYTSNPSGYNSTAVTTASIPSKGTLTLYLYVDDLLSVYTGTSKWEGVEISFVYNGQTIWGETLFYYYGSGSGWSSR